MSTKKKPSPESIVREIKRKIRRKYSAEEKIRIVLEGRLEARVVKVAREYPEKSCREVAFHITDKEGYFISESSVYRILKAHDLVTSAIYIVISAKDEFEHPAHCVNEKWQSDFTYLKVIDWDWYYLSTVLDDYFRYMTPAELEARISEWVDHYNNQPYHEAIDNVTPSDRFFGRNKELLKYRQRTKSETMLLRRKLYRRVMINNLTGTLS
jgi:transposase InsO family protein